MTNFLITGATGNLGARALRHLSGLVDPQSVSVLVRSAAATSGFAASGITAHQGNYSLPDTLIAALRGIDRLLFVSSPVLDPSVRVAQHMAVLSAAEQAGVEHIVYTSAYGAEHDPGHRTTEETLSNRGIAHTVLRNSLYTDPFVAKALAESAAGVIISASGGEALATAAIDDLAEAAARSLVEPPDRQLWELRGPAWTYPELAESLGRVTGHPVIHREVTDQETGPFSVLFPLVRRKVFAIDTDDLRTLIGRPPTGPEEVAELQLRGDPRSR